MSERPEPGANVDPAPDFSISRFFHDAYDKGVVRAIEECPREAALTAAGVIGGAAAAIYLTKGGALAEMLGAAGGKAGQAIKPAAEGLMDGGLPIMAGTRAAAASAAKDALFRQAERPANIFSLVLKSESELASIASRMADKGEPLFKMADTTMSVSNPQKWRFLLEAGGHDEYNAEVLKLANRWGTLAEKQMA
jgi:hypothetical protein